MADNGAHLTNARYAERVRLDNEVVSRDGVAGALTVEGAAIADGIFGLGAHETATIASGVLTVTKSYVWAAAESSTTDQVDSIVFTGAADGTLLLLVADTGDTITFDDAAINLGAATRAVAPGGCILLRFDGTSWAEVLFLAAADNA